MKDVLPSLRPVVYSQEETGQDEECFNAQEAAREGPGKEVEEEDGKQGRGPYDVQSRHIFFVIHIFPFYAAEAEKLRAFALRRILFFAGTKKKTPRQRNAVSHPTVREFFEGCKGVVNLKLNGDGRALSGL